MRKYDDVMALLQHEPIRYFNHTRFIYSRLHFVLIDADPPLILFAADNQKTDLRQTDEKFLEKMCVFFHM